MSDEIKAIVLRTLISVVIAIIGGSLGAIVLLKVMGAI